MIPLKKMAKPAAEYFLATAKDGSWTAWINAMSGRISTPIPGALMTYRLAKAS
jgi:hypothetical protein